VTLLNWPPAKGEKPPHLQVKRTYEAPVPSRADFDFRQPRHAVEERRVILSAALDHHGQGDAVEEKIGASIPRAGRVAPIPRRTLERDFRLNHHVATVGTLTLEQADELLHGCGALVRRLERDLAPRPVSVDIVYPLSVGVRLKLRPFTVVEEWGDGTRSEEKRMSVGYVLWSAAREYERIYLDWAKYKVWGHGLEDLVFERLLVRPRGRLDLWVGS